MTTRIAKPTTITCLKGLPKVIHADTSVKIDGYYLDAADIPERWLLRRTSDQKPVWVFRVVWPTKST